MTYIVASSYKERQVITGYFSLTNKITEIKKSLLSYNMRRRLAIFAINDEVNKSYSVSIPLIGQLGKNYKKEYNNALVYCAIFETSGQNGLEIDMLYVSDEKWDWNKDKDKLTNGEPLVYSKNFDYADRTGEFYVSLERISFKEA